MSACKYMLCSGDGSGSGHGDLSLIGVAVVLAGGDDFFVIGNEFMFHSERN